MLGAEAKNAPPRTRTAASNPAPSFADSLWLSYSDRCGPAATMLGACPSNGMGRAHRACEVRSRREEEAMRDIGDDEQRRTRPQSPCALRVPAACRHLRRCRSWTRAHLAGVAAPCIYRHGARNATHAITRTGS